MKSDAQQAAFVAVGSHFVRDVEERLTEQLTVLNDANASRLFHHKQAIVARVCQIGGTCQAAFDDQGQINLKRPWLPYPATAGAPGVSVAGVGCTVGMESVEL
jgi:hypothetical protein